MLNFEEMVFASENPYPEIIIENKNMRYAKMMLDNYGGTHSEMSAISLYLYNNLISEHDFKDISFVFHKMSVVEMHHLRIFGKLAIALGENPILCSQSKNSRVLWSPGYNRYPTYFGKLMHNALNSELMAIEKYEKQLSLIDDKCITSNLRRIIVDEKIHVQIFSSIINEYDL